MGDDSHLQPPSPPRVAICVATRQRPKGLARLLNGLNKLVFCGAAADVRVIVIENEEDGPAKDVCDAARPAYRWALEWHVEPQRGISFARNRAVACAGDAVDFVAFIDDDEMPEPNWLDELLRVQRECEADVVTGPVLRRFEGDEPPWVVRSRLFEMPRLPTGTVLSVARTGNVLVRRAALRAVDGPFDPRFALTGGEDSHCFQRIHRAGYRIVWADEAIAHEVVPASRLCLSWITRHAYRLGNSWAVREYELNRSASTRLRTVGRAVGRLARGAVLMLLAPVWGRAAVARSLYNIGNAAGLMAGLVGGRYEAYHSVHGN